MKNRIFISLLWLGAFLLIGPNTGSGQGVWSSITPMPTTAGFLGAVPYNGKIYLIGGASPNHTVATKKGYVFNPADSSYTPLPDMPQVTSSAGVVEVDGKIYVMGGSNAVLGDVIYNTTYVFDPTLGIWTLGPPMPHPRVLFTAAAVGKKIYCIGGGSILTPPTTTKTVDVFDTETQTWSAGVNLPSAKGFLASAVVEGKIYVFGGTVDVYGIGLNTVHIFNPATGFWTSGKPMPTKRFGAAAAVLNGKIYVLGGSSLDAANPFFNTAERYDPASDTWETLPPMLTGARGRAAVALGDKIYVFGGMASDNGVVILPSNAAEVFELFVGVDELPELTETVRVAPNPAVDRVTFRFDTPVTGRLQLFRADGALLYSEAWSNRESVHITLAGLPAGICFWQYQGANGRSAGGKLWIAE